MAIQPPPVLVRCDICGAIFAPTVAHITRHCSTACLTLAARRRAARMGTDAACDYCAAVFPDQVEAKRKGRRFCDRRCYGQYRREQTSKAWMANVALVSFDESTLTRTVTHEADATPAPVTPTRPTVVYDGVEFEVCWTGATGWTGRLESWCERGRLLPPCTQRAERGSLGGPDAVDTEDEQ